jgi:flagellar hook protein FlgE
MLRSLFAGVSGLRNHQVRMDVIGNNIANVNTVAFKSGRVTFKEGFAQLLQGASRPPGDHGGTNPIQVGLGMQVGSIDQLFTQGNIESTGVNTDIAIQGNSMFVVRKGNQSFYTRSGNFQIDAAGQLVSPTNGFVVQGKIYENGALLDGIQDIKLPFGQKVSAKSTTKVDMTGNLNSSAKPFDLAVDPDGAGPAVPGFNAESRALPVNAGSWTESRITTYDSLGNKFDLKVQLYKTGDNTWEWTVDRANLVAAGVPDASITGAGTLTFNTDGTLATPTTPELVSFAPPGAEPMTIRLNFGSGTNGLSQFAGSHTAVLRDQDGYTAGTLQNFSIDRIGTITGYFTNGTTTPLAKIVLADFNNPAGMLRVGDNMYQESGNSGGAVLGFALEGSQSEMTSGALEMSNVDLAQEFTNMIIAQRGFQANGKVVTTSDEMLQELMQIKR